SRSGCSAAAGVSRVVLTPPMLASDQAAAGCGYLGAGAEMAPGVSSVRLVSTGLAASSAPGATQGPPSPRRPHQPAGHGLHHREFADSIDFPDFSRQGALPAPDAAAAWLRCLSTARGPAGRFYCRHRTLGGTRWLPGMPPLHG